MFEFGGAHGGCAALHHDEPAGIVRQPCRIGERRARCERECKGRNDRIARAGNVDRLLCADGGNVNWRRIIFQQRHALAATCDEQRVMTETLLQLLRRSFQIFS